MALHTQVAPPSCIIQFNSLSEKKVLQMKFTDFKKLFFEDAIISKQHRANRTLHLTYTANKIDDATGNVMLTYEKRNIFRHVNVDNVQTLSDSHIATLQPVLIACDNTPYPGA